MTPNRKLRVFLCHASQDKPIVRELYQRLLAKGWIDSWLDEEKLLPGQDWDLEIEKAVEAADVVVVCLSNNSISKEGYIQRELRFVLDIALEKPEGTIFVIPLRLDDCELPRRLRSWHYVDYFPIEQWDSAYRKLLQSLEVRSDQLQLKMGVGKRVPTESAEVVNIALKEKKFTRQQETVEQVVDSLAKQKAANRKNPSAMIIGLGGAGKKILTSLKTRFMQEFGSVPNNIRLVSFDIDTYQEETTLDGKTIRLIPNEEFFDIGNVPAGDIFRQLKAKKGVYPELQAWLDPDISLAESNIRRGGQRNRQLGRLAFYWNLQTRNLRTVLEMNYFQLNELDPTFRTHE